MRSAGLTVQTFESGADFLKSLETGLPDCVVLDLHMPHMDGFNVQTQLAQKCAALPVIILTGHDFPEARERAMAEVQAALALPRLPRRIECTDISNISGALAEAVPAVVARD